MLLPMILAVLASPLRTVELIAFWSDQTAVQSRRKRKEVRQSMMQTACRVTAAALVAGLMTACAVKPALISTVLVPAQSDAVASFRQLAVLPFEQRRGDPDVAGEVESMLVGISINGRPYFTVVERRRLQAILSEQQLSNWGYVSDERAAAAGRLLGAQAVLSGILVRHDVVSRPYEGLQQICVRYEQREDRRGKPTQGRCIEFGRQTVRCERLTATVVLRPRLVAVETGAIVFSRELAGTAEAARCQGDATTAFSVTDLLSQARRQALDQLRAALAPTIRHVSIPLMVDLKGVVPVPAQSQHERALEFARVGRPDRACALWEQAVTIAPTVPTLLHNLGACAESVGDLEGASNLFARADRLAERPERTISEAIERIRQGIADRERLRQQEQVRY